MNDQSITTQKLFIHCLSIGTATSNLSDHPPFLGSPGDEIGKIIPTQSSQREEYTPLHVYSNYPLARHCLSVSLYMSTQEVRQEALLNKVHRQRLSSLPFWGERPWSVSDKKGGERGNAFKVVNQARQGREQTFELSKEDEYLWTGRWRERKESCSPINVQRIKMKCVYNYCVQRWDTYAPIPSICNQSIPIDISLSIDGYWRSIPIDNHTNLWYWLISIVIDYRFDRLDTPGSFGIWQTFWIQHWIAHCNKLEYGNYLTLNFSSTNFCYYSSMTYVFRWYHQAFWRGYRVRCEVFSLKVKRARKRIKSANAAATEPMKLCNRTRSALDFLLQCKNISRIVGALVNLGKFRLDESIEPHCLSDSNIARFSGFPGHTRKEEMISLIQPLNCCLDVCSMEDPPHRKSL